MMKSPLKSESEEAAKPMTHEERLVLIMKPFPDVSVSDQRIAHYGFCLLRRQRGNSTSQLWRRRDAE